MAMFNSYVKVYQRVSYQKKNKNIITMMIIQLFTIHSPLLTTLILRFGERFVSISTFVQRPKRGLSLRAEMKKSWKQNGMSMGSNQNENIW